VSRVGRKPITIAKGVKVQAKDHHVTITGPKGELTADVHPDIAMDINENQITLSRSSDMKEQRALHGLWRALLQNMVKGVTEGYTKKLELVGVGYRAELKGKKLQLAVGYSHPILFDPPTVSTSSWSDRSRQRSVPSANLSPTRGRGSSMKAKPSVARRARRLPRAVPKHK
jgi:ribosomal protein L6P/L9E